MIGVLGFALPLLVWLGAGPACQRLKNWRCSAR